MENSTLLGNQKLLWPTMTTGKSSLAKHHPFKNQTVASYPIAAWAACRRYHRITPATRRCRTSRSHHAGSSARWPFDGIYGPRRQASIRSCGAPAVPPSRHRRACSAAPARPDVLGIDVTRHPDRFAVALAALRATILAQDKQVSFEHMNEVWLREDGANGWVLVFAIAVSFVPGPPLNLGVCCDIVNLDRFDPLLRKMTRWPYKTQRASLA